MRRALKALLLWVSVIGIVCPLGSVGPPGPSEPGVLDPPSPGSARVRYSVVPERSEVRYRVREQLAGLNFSNEAVGTTSAVNGSISFEIQGRVLSGESRFAVDLRTLRSDEARRDNYNIRLEADLVLRRSL